MNHQTLAERQALARARVASHPLRRPVARLEVEHLRATQRAAELYRQLADAVKRAVGG